MESTFPFKRMNFEDLKIVVNQVKRTMKCLGCKGRYSDANIEIVGCLDCQDLFFNVWCEKCSLESTIHVEMDPHWFENSETRLGTAPRMGRVSSNEVLDMHNFLKGFNGDFLKLFTPKSTH